MDQPALSVIVPAAGEEPALPALRECLAGDPRVGELLVKSEGSRAASLNAGAREAAGELFWFLHADSSLSPETIPALVKAARDEAEALLFFDLAFDDAGGPLPRLNAAGANLRSRLLRLPFGDQGLACRRAVFERIGPFPEDAAYGEDHLFVWRAHRAGVPVRPVGAPLVTSARRYRAQGWLRLSLLYQYRWLAQALPQAGKLLAERGR